MSSLGYRSKQLLRANVGLRDSSLSFNVNRALLKFLTKKLNEACLKTTTTITATTPTDTTTTTPQLHISQKGTKGFPGAWEGGEVTLWVSNTLTRTVELECRIAAPPDTGPSKQGAPSTQQRYFNGEVDSWARRDAQEARFNLCGAILPARGQRFRVHDGDRFEVFQAGERIDAWVVDVSQGPVQDHLID